MAFDEATIQQVWEKGRATNDREPSEWRKDECGAWMQRAAYGGQTSEYGWKIVNVTPGSENKLANLRPFHLENDFNQNSGKALCRVTTDRDAISPTAHVDTPHNRQT